MVRRREETEKAKQKRYEKKMPLIGVVFDR